MQTPTDYREFFRFSLLQPMGLTDECQVEALIEDLYKVNAIPLIIIDDESHPLITYNRQMLGVNIKIILIAISYEHNPYLA